VRACRLTVIAITNQSKGIQHREGIVLRGAARGAKIGRALQCARAHTGFF
jgi:hypothetical protein